MNHVKNQTIVAPLKPEVISISYDLHLLTSLWPETIAEPRAQLTDREWEGSHSLALCWGYY